LTAILDWGFVGKQVRPATIALVASAWLIAFALVGGEEPSRDEATASDEAMASDEELADPEWLTTSEDDRNVSKFGNDASLFGFYAPTFPYFDPDREANALEYQTLLASLSPGVRANYRAWLLDRAYAREKERERDEAEYAVFIEEHLRRLNTGRRSKK
jgi:hypothetical protein